MRTVDDNTFDSIVETDYAVLVVFGDKNNGWCTSLLSEIDGIKPDHSNISFNFCDAAEDVSYDYYIGGYASSVNLVMFKGGKNVDSREINSSDPGVLKYVKSLCGKWNQPP